MARHDFESSFFFCHRFCHILSFSILPIWAFFTDFHDLAATPNCQHRFLAAVDFESIGQDEAPPL
jgi:hypothetical protein